MKILILDEYANIRAETLSEGTKRKLYYALTFMANPKLQFFDEPTTGVDPLATMNFLMLLNQTKRKSVLLTSHNLKEVEQLCDKLLYLDGGIIIFNGSP